MKRLILLLFFFTTLYTAYAQQEPEFDGHKWQAPYSLPSPEGWGIERFRIPISFAPTITYKGIEDIRFAPGWAKTASDEYWSYAFLWYLDSLPVTNEKIIAGNLNAYYTGLVNINFNKEKFPGVSIPAVKTAFKKEETVKGDLQTYSGTIAMLDYMTAKPITLNCIVHVWACPGNNKGFIFYELSPMRFMHKVWDGLGKLWTDFKCSNTN